MASPVDSTIVFFGTADLDATSHFYEGILGLPLVLDQGRCRIYRCSQDGFVGFCLRKEPVHGERAILTLVSDDVDGWADRLRDAGVELEKAPAHNDVYGIYHLFVYDPNGILVEVQRFDDPRWADGP
ncbi:MAG: VOC family protein [Candidatus Bipolaricaulota bacterium]|nr:MAG: VOC family protein [Candidatus Bipolaricaulota bacterium]